MDVTQHGQSGTPSAEVALLEGTVASNHPLLAKAQEILLRELESDRERLRQELRDLELEAKARGRAREETVARRFDR